MAGEYKKIFCTKEYCSHIIGKCPIIIVRNGLNVFYEIII